MAFGAAHFILIGLAIVLCNVLLIVIIRRRNSKKQSERIQNQVNEAVSQYFRLQTSDH
jgi:competence protein ComGC